jgi:hypothetical protein
MAFYVYKGSQDKFVTEGLYDIRKQFLNKNYHVLYRKLDYELTESPANNIRKKALVFKILQTCDMINLVDLSFKGTVKDIKSIEVEYGGQLIDRLLVEDLETQIKTNSVIFGRKITYLNEKIIMPLVMAPFHVTNIVSPSTKYHELKIWIELNNDIQDVELYGKCYYIENYIRKEHQFVTIQNSYCGSQIIKTGTNNLKIYFNHPVCLIYFWGFDKSKVTNIKFTINDAIYYDGSLDNLEHDKKYDVEPCMICFSDQEIYKPTSTTINFSRVDKSELIIDTTQEIPSDCYIVGLNLQVMRYLDELYGLMFSK